METQTPITHQSVATTNERIVRGVGVLAPVLVAFSLLYHDYFVASLFFWFFAALISEAAFKFGDWRSDVQLREAFLEKLLSEPDMRITPHERQLLRFIQGQSASYYLGQSNDSLVEIAEYHQFRKINQFASRSIATGLSMAGGYSGAGVVLAQEGAYISSATGILLAIMFLSMACSKRYLISSLRRGFLRGLLKEINSRLTAHERRLLIRLGKFGLL